MRVGDGAYRALSPDALQKLPDYFSEEFEASLNAAGEKMLAEGVFSPQVGRQIPVMPAVIAAEGNFVAACECSGDSDCHRHRFAAGPGKADLFRPRVEFTKEIR